MFHSGGTRTGQAGRPPLTLRDPGTHAWELLRDSARLAGLDLLGATAPGRNPEIERRYDAWLRAQHHGGMGYLERHRDAKADPRAYQPACRSVLCFGLGYRQADPAPADRAGAGRVARYAWGRDYHRVLGGKLRAVARALKQAFPGEVFLAAVDSNPLLETHLGRDADLGFLGKHTLLINRRLGSWFVLGEVLTSVRFPDFQRIEHASRRCGVGCTFCIDVCPTRAIIAPHQLDARRCIAYLTIEHRGSIPVELRPAIGDWLFGCDLCQEVCPWNVRAAWTQEHDFLQHRAGPTLDLGEVLALENDEQFRDRFAGTPIMRAQRTGLVRNACVVAANQQAHHLLPRLRELAGGDDAIIAEHAGWAVERLAEATC